MGQEEKEEIKDFDSKADLLLRMYINGAIPLSKMLEDLDMKDIADEIRKYGIR